MEDFQWAALTRAIEVRPPPLNQGEVSDGVDVSGESFCFDRQSQLQLSLDAALLRSSWPVVEVGKSADERHDLNLEPAKACKHTIMQTKVSSPGNARWSIDRTVHHPRGSRDCY